MPYTSPACSHGIVSSCALVKRGFPSALLLRSRNAGRVLCFFVSPGWPQVESVPEPDVSEAEEEDEEVRPAYMIPCGQP